MSVVAGDVFGLGDVFALQSNPTTTGILDDFGNPVTSSAWSNLSSHGWFGGDSGALSIVDRIDFSNDSATASPRGPLSLGRFDLAATGNSNYGWFGGGGTPALVSTVDRIDYSNDSATASPRGPLPQARTILTATGNSNYGWFGGGSSLPGLTPVATVDRIDYSNDSATASSRGPLSSTRDNSAATGNSDYGWFGGGGVPAVVSSTNRIDYSNDSATASPRGPLSQARNVLAATGNSNYGWFGGGGLSPTPATVSTVDRIDFSNDSAVASVRGPLGEVRRSLAATGNSNYGWFVGGNPGDSTVVYRIDYSNDLTAAPRRGALSSTRATLAATSGQAKSSSIRLQKAGNFGWFGGGSPGPVSTVDRIDFSNDSATASSRGALSLQRVFTSATGNSNYGWFGGGTGPAVTVSTVDRIDFSNDSARASVRGPLSSSRVQQAATGNSNYGWFGGGEIPSPPSTLKVSSVDRIDFSNDSATASPRGPLSATRYSLSATGNSNYGLFGGGGISSPVTYYSIVDRIDFSNDSVAASPRGPLSVVRQSLAATGNSNYGWFGGGSPGPVSTIDRIDFSNDSVAASPRGPLSAVRIQLTATGNPNYGWFGGGSGPLSTVDRINFSNDSVAASPRGPLFLARAGLTATSNTPVG